MSTVCSSPQFASLHFSDLALHLLLIWFVYCACFWLPVSPVWLNQKPDSYLTAQRSADRQDIFDYVCFLSFPSAEHLHRGASKMRDSQGCRKLHLKYSCLWRVFGCPLNSESWKNNKIRKWNGKKRSDLGKEQQRLEYWKKEKEKLVIGKVLSYHQKLVNYMDLPNQFLHVLLLRCFSLDRLASYKQVFPLLSLHPCLFHGCCFFSSMHISFSLN